MALVDVVQVHPFVSLAVIAIMLGASIVASLMYSRHHPKAEAAPEAAVREERRLEPLREEP